MRYAGAIMIFLACAGGGFYKAMQIKSRVRTLSSLIAALELLKGEIADRLSDLPTALENTRGGASGEAACFIGALCQSSREIGDRPFADIWRQCAQEKLPSLRENELSALISLGGMLGRYDGETQAQAIDAASVQRIQALGTRLALVRDQLARVAALADRQAATVLPPVEPSTYGSPKGSAARIYRAAG